MKRRLPGAALLLAAAAGAALAPPPLQAQGMVVGPPRLEARAPTQPAPPAPAASVLARRPGERSDDAITIGNLFGGPFSVGLEYEVVHQWREDFDLDPARARDRARLDQELKLEAFWRARPWLSLFVRVTGLSERDTQRDSGPLQKSAVLERDQTWVYIETGGGTALQAGRIAVVEPRTWWWDEDLDALRLFAGGARWQMEAALARELAPLSVKAAAIEPDRQQVLRALGRAAWAWQPRHSLELFWLVQRDRSAAPRLGDTFTEATADASDADLQWAGVRASGDARYDSGARFGYWLDAAAVRGNERLARLDEQGDLLVVDRVTERRVRGHAVDAGLMWTLGVAGRPTLTLGFARGSGDADPGDNVDARFRQTGLQENKARFRGVTRFRYYGEMLRPEQLSNLEIATVGLGFRPTGESSVDLIGHRYRQPVVSTSMPDSRLDADPDGLDRALGTEVDLVLGWRATRWLDLAVRGGVFRAGQAFGDKAGRRAAYGEVGLKLTF